VEHQNKGTIMLFSPFQMHDLLLKNRIVMAPLTRCRAGVNDCPTALTTLYYQQRASAGLIISEATQISPQGKGYAHTPGIYSQDQIKAWKKVTNAVHKAGGLIFSQLWHVGRISHPFLQPNQQLPVAPSAICPSGKAFTEQGFFDFVTPRALETHEIAGIIEQYRHAAMCAKKAGFDGIEIHAANGYLLDQFLRSGTNHRNDIYGGTIANRIRLITEVIDAVLQVWPKERIGIRLSPISKIHDMTDENPENTYSHLIEILNQKKIAYIHIVEGSTDAKERPLQNDFNFFELKKKFKGIYIANNLYSKALAIDALNTQHADLISFGKPFIANATLVNKFKHDLPLRTAPRETWYGGNEQGYTDWPD
jgi:N-ethylmaleimide reductase